jgi:hypothetical protein
VIEQGGNVVIFSPQFELLDTTHLEVGHLKLLARSDGKAWHISVATSA